MSSPDPDLRLPFLCALHPDVQPVEYVLRGEVCTLGRTEGCDIVVGRHVVSRLHARIERQGQRYLLSDLGSANGTFLDGQLIHGPHLLFNEARIGLASGEALLVFHDPEATVQVPRRLRFDERAQSFLYQGQKLALTPNLRRLLQHLYINSGQVCTRESCVRAVWGEPGSEDPTDYPALLHREIADLRRELARIDPAAQLIATERGVGYRLEVG